jgi:hypothetical protein
MGLGWITSMIPFVNLLPTLSISTWRIVANERKADREALKKWDAANAKQKDQQVANQQAVAGQRMQAEAANAQAELNELADNPI